MYITITVLWGIGVIWTGIFNHLLLEDLIASMRNDFNAEKENLGVVVCVVLFILFLITWPLSVPIRYMSFG